MLAVVALISADSGWSALLRATAWLHLIQAAGGGLRLPHVFAHFPGPLAAWGMHFSWWITGIHEGKWKQKVPPRALAVTSTSIPSPRLTSIEWRQYTPPAPVDRTAESPVKGRGGKCDKLGSDNPIYQSHFPHPSLSFFNQTMRSLNQVTIQCSFLKLK